MNTNAAQRESNPKGAASHGVSQCQSSKRPAHTPASVLFRGDMNWGWKPSGQSHSWKSARAASPVPRISDLTLLLQEFYGIDIVLPYDFKP